MERLKISKLKMRVTIGILIIAVAIIGTILTNGWSHSGGGLRYLRYGYAVTGYKHIDGKDFIFNKDGVLYIGWFEYEGNTYYQTEDGLFEGDMEVNGELYHFEEDGRFLSGIFEDENGVLCFRDDHGFNLVGAVSYKGNDYYVNADGTLYKGWLSVDATGPYYDKETGIKAVGFTNVNGRYYLFDEDGYTLKGWQETDEGRRYFNENGVMQTGTITVDGIVYYLTDDGLATTGLVESDGNYYYFLEDGTMVKGWFEEDGYYRYFNGSGVMQTGILETVNGTYYLDEDGIRVTGFVTLEEGYFYFDPENEGKMYYGWYENEDGSRWFFAEGGRVNGWVIIDMDTYYFKEYVPVTGWQTINGKNYKFTDEGKMLTGWQDKNGVTVYLDPTDGHMVMGEEITIDGFKYKFEEDGSVKQGFIDGVFWLRGYIGSGIMEIDGVYYWILEDGTKSTGGWVTCDGELYHFESDGSATTGWNNIDGNDYYFENTGKMAKNTFVSKDHAIRYLNENGTYQEPGWITVGSYKYYIINDVGQVATGYRSIDGLTYYFLNDGKMANSVTNINGKYYAYNTSGQLYAAGWQDISGFRYYVYEDGTVATGTVTIDGVAYTFTDSGALNDKAAKVAAMLDVANGYSSSTDYIIIVDRANYLVAIFQGTKGSYSLVTNFDCAVGALSSPTITGQYTLGDKFYYFDHGSARLFYASRIWGGYLFHSVLYYQDPTPQRVMDGRVGMNLSLGCVRLEIDNAKYIYDNMPRGTTVVIY